MSQTHFGYQTVDEDEKAGRVRQVFDSVAQRSDVMRDFHRLEQQTWREYLEASKEFPVASPIDVRFYHLEVEPAGAVLLVPDDEDEAMRRFFRGY